MAAEQDPTPLHRALESAREVTAAQIEALSRDFDGVVAASADVATDDEHDPEGATIGFERAQLSGLLQAARRRLGDLDAAADRLEAGSYGICERCGESIPAERLAARPATDTCVACAGHRRR